MFLAVVDVERIPETEDLRVDGDVRKVSEEENESFLVDYSSGTG